MYKIFQLIQWVYCILNIIFKDIIVKVFDDQQKVCFDTSINLKTIIKSNSLITNISLFGVFSFYKTKQTIDIIAPKLTIML